MALVNHAKKEINAKIVYVGPESAGKSTNLHHIFGKLKEAFRGAFKSMNLQNDRMLFFDFIPSGQGTLNGYTIRFHIYTVTGKDTRPSSWKMVLKGVDGVVFVADSDPARGAANVESLRMLTSCLGAFGKSLADIPCVIQCNKRDLPGAVPLEELGRALNPGGLAVIPAVARGGEGVLESIFNVVKMVMKNLRAGGLDVDRQAEQLQRTAMAAAPVHHEEPSFEEAGWAEAERPIQGEIGAVPEELPATGEEPVVAFAGKPEIIQGGHLHLPLSIRYDGKEKRFALDISLLQDHD
ncbi:MAG TPA: ADP-ribosylation factor-like protein [Geobacteraceae bacterium]|nr:ADP-ribosylation factor-like protein [Geobacteraceae bacterium]